MTLLKLIIFAVFATHCLCAPSTTRESNNTTRCIDSNSEGPCLECAFKILLCLLALIVLGCFVVCVSECPTWYRQKTTCRHYTTARDATVENVYKQLRRKWRAHEKAKDHHIENSELPTTFFLDDNKMNYMKQLMDDVKFYNAQCRKFFPTKEYSGGVVPSTTDFSLHFEKECAAIETFAAKVEQMKKVLPLRRTNSG